MRGKCMAYDEYWSIGPSLIEDRRKRDEIEDEERKTQYEEFAKRCREQNRRSEKAQAKRDELIGFKEG
jgi:hypothetical protein